MLNFLFLRKWCCNKWTKREPKGPTAGLIIEQKQETMWVLEFQNTIVLFYCCL